MRLFVLALAAGFSLLGPVAAANAQEAAATEEADPIADLPWSTGPVDGSFGKRATIGLPEGYAFLGADGTRRFNEINENPPSGVDEYVVAPLDLSWAAYFSFDEVGYVRTTRRWTPSRSSPPCAKATNRPTPSAASAAGTRSTWWAGASSRSTTSS